MRQSDPQVESVLMSAENFGVAQSAGTLSNSHVTDLSSSTIWGRQVDRPFNQVSSKPSRLPGLGNFMQRPVRRLRWE
jgi:hypothetical protein